MTEGIDPVEAALGEVAAETGATVRRAPRAGREVRRVVLRDLRDELGSQSELVGNLVATMSGGARRRLAVKVRAVIKRIEADGWRLVRQTGSHRQFRHPSSLVR